MGDERVSRSPGAPALRAVLEDLEQQAHGLGLQERDQDVEALRVAEYASVTLGERLHASVGCELTVVLPDGVRLVGRLGRAGRDFGLVEAGPVDWLFVPAAVVRIDGLSARAVSEAALPVLSRLSLASMLRRVVDEADTVALHLCAGPPVEGTIERVGEDFVELARPACVVPRSALAAVRVLR